MAALRTQSTPSLDKALTILEALGRSKVGLALPELVAMTGMPKSTVHCLLVTLERRGYLYRKERIGRYVLGHRLFNLANQALSGIRLRELAEPYLRRLMDSTRLTVHMGILEQDQAILVAKFDPPGTYPVATWVGKRMEMHCTAMGKAMAAYLEPEELEHLVRDFGLPRHNDNTISSSKRLKEDMKAVVERGYSIDDEEDELGFRCVGAPIFDGERRVIGAVSVSGTTEQLSGFRLLRAGEQVCGTTTAITGRMQVDPHVAV